MAIIILKTIDKNLYLKYFNTFPFLFNHKYSGKILFLKISHNQHSH